MITVVMFLNVTYQIKPEVERNKQEFLVYELCKKNNIFVR